MTNNGEIVSEDGKYHYKTWRKWDGSRPPVIFILANEISGDVTIDRCIRFAKDWLCGAAILLPLFALKVKDNRDIVVASKSNEDRLRIIGPETDIIIYDTFVENPMSQIICGWGPFGMLTKRGDAMMRLIREVGRKPLCIDQAPEGFPRPPSDIHISWNKFPVEYKGPTYVWK